MNIETKFDLGDEVFLLKDNCVFKAIICEIITRNAQNIYDFTVTKFIYYNLTNKQNFYMNNYSENELFKTKKELLNSL
jgi:hypothetical protein